MRKFKSSKAAQSGTITEEMVKMAIAEHIVNGLMAINAVVGALEASALVIGLLNLNWHRKLQAVSASIGWIVAIIIIILAYGLIIGVTISLANQLDALLSHTSCVALVAVIYGMLPIVLTTLIVNDSQVIADFMHSLETPSTWWQIGALTIIYLVSAYKAFAMAKDYSKRQYQLRKRIQEDKG